jgi:hypothetical protein
MRKSTAGKILVKNSAELTAALAAFASPSDALMAIEVSCDVAELEAVRVGASPASATPELPTYSLVPISSTEDLVDAPKVARKILGGGHASRPQPIIERFEIMWPTSALEQAYAAGFEAGSA